jgi:hypothetical protein
VGPNCNKNDSEIASFLKGGIVNFGFNNKYVDLNSYNDTIKKYFNDELFWPVVTNYARKIDVFIKKNELETRDGLFSIGGADL